MKKPRKVHYVARNETTGRYRPLPKGWRPGNKVPRGCTIHRVRVKPGA